MPTEKPWPIEAYLAERLEAAIPKAGLMLPEGARIDVEVPREPEHGDWATPVALTLAKTARRPPRQVAETLRDVLVKEIERDVVSSIEIAGAGFINFRLAPAWLTANLTRILENPGVYGSSPVGRGEKILIEYVSANPTGPLNVVNARAASIGDALIRILNAAGYEARGEFYANDWGLQAELFGASIETRFQERLGLPASPLPEEGYAGAYVAEVARTVPEQDGRSWLGLPERERRLRFAGWGIDRMLERQKVDLDRFGARMDRWFRESELHRGGAVEKARARLGERGMTETRDGALWFRSTEFGTEGVILSAPLHDKFSRGFDRLIDLLGPDHHGHVQRMQGVIEALGWPRDRFEVILIQWVRLLRGGEPVKMSKRAGEFITLEDLVQEVGVDAARFFFLMRRAESPLDFDLELAVKRSEDNPVYYVQYAHARIVHVLEYATSQGVPEPSLAAARPDLLHEAETLTLLRGLAGFPSLVAAAARHREPHRIPMYLKDLAARFHSFYHVHRVVGPDAAVTAARLLLTRATGVVFRRGLELLGVSAPESM